MGDAITVDNVSKRFRLYHERNQSLKATVMRRGRARYEDFWALRDVSFAVEEGSTFGLIGHNGSGKSTMLKCLARILQPDAGSLSVDGRISALLELGAGFHPELSGRENIYLNGSILGLSRREVDRRFDEIVAFAGLEQFIDMPVKNYSSGMYVRLGFSVAIAVDPDILLVDEVLAVGDEEFQRRCNERFAELRQSGRTIVIVSHGLGAVEQMCDQAAWLDHGVLKLLGPAPDVVDAYLSQVEVAAVTSAERDAEGEPRSGELTLGEVTVLDGAGAPTHRLATGDRGVVSIAWSCPVPIQRPLVRLRVSTSDGFVVSVASTNGANLPDVFSGAGELHLEIPELTLLPGTYDISVEVTDSAGLHQFDQRRRAARLEVAPGHPHGEGGVTPMRGVWSAR
ncbi:MAG: ABC transporter ATP-binding protein [Microthrixaceae bacterium]